MTSSPLIFASMVSDHIEKCIFLLAFAVTVQPSDLSGDSSPPDNQSELQETIEVIQLSSSICKQLTLNLSDVQSHFSNLIQFISYPVVSKGVLCWFSQTMKGSDFFQIYPIHGPIYFVLLDEISEKHCLLHPDVFELLIELLGATNQGIEMYHELELQQTVLDHMVHLFVCGYSIEVRIRPDVASNVSRIFHPAARSRLDHGWDRFERSHSPSWSVRTNKERLWRQGKK